MPDKEHQKIIAEYVKANQNHIYHAENMPAFDMRGYAQYVKEKGLDPKEISLDILNGMLGNRIRVLRNARNLTQEQVADQIGISRQKYAGIENGINSITLDTLSKVAAVFDVTVDDITKVLEETPEYRAEENGASQKIFDMLDLFYANKHLYGKLQ